MYKDEPYVVQYAYILVCILLYIYIIHYMYSMCSANACFFGAVNKLSNRLKLPQTRSSIAMPGHFMDCRHTMYGAEHVFGLYFRGRGCFPLFQMGTVRNVNLIAYRWTTGHSCFWSQFSFGVSYLQPVSVCLRNA